VTPIPGGQISSSATSPTKLLGVDDPVLSHRDCRLEAHAVQVELAAVVGLIVDAPQHVVDGGLVCADMEGLPFLASGPVGDLSVTTHPLSGFGSQSCRGVEVLWWPVRMGACVVPGQSRDEVVVQGGVGGIDCHSGRVLVLTCQGAAGAFLLPLSPSVDPVQVDEELLVAGSAQHVPVAREVDQPFHGSILRVALSPR
jgi:hypothetical protein